MITLQIEEEYAEPYSVEVEHEELPGGGALMRAAFDDGAILLVFSPEERRSWPHLAWTVGQAVDAWLEAGPGFPYCFSQAGLRYQLQSYAGDRIQINETPA